MAAEEVERRHTPLTFEAPPGMGQSGPPGLGPPGMGAMQPPAHAAAAAAPWHHPQMQQQQQPQQQLLQQQQPQQPGMVWTEQGLRPSPMMPMQQQQQQQQQFPAGGVRPGWGPGPQLSGNALLAAQGQAARAAAQRFNAPPIAEPGTIAERDEICTLAYRSLVKQVQGSCRAYGGEGSGAPCDLGSVGGMWSDPGGGTGHVPVGTLITLVSGTGNYAKPINMEDLPSSAPEPVTLDSANEYLSCASPPQITRADIVDCIFPTGSFAPVVTDQPLVMLEVMWRAGCVSVI